jgi:hypothetical protein
VRGGARGECTVVVVWKSVFERQVPGWEPVGRPLRAIGARFLRVARPVGASDTRAPREAAEAVPQGRPDGLERRPRFVPLSSLSVALLYALPWPETGSTAGALAEGVEPVSGQSRATTRAGRASEASEGRA